MTEAEWLTASNHCKMLKFLNGKVSKRKQQLLVCAFVRRMLAGQQFNRLDVRLDYISSLIPLLEHASEDQGAEKDMFDAIRFAPPLQEASIQRRRIEIGLEHDEDFTDVVEALAIMLIRAGIWRNDLNSYLCMIDIYLKAAVPSCEWGMVTAKYCQSIKEVFGNPFRPVSINPGWLTPTVLTIAHGIYEDRAFDRLAFLADALQNAGCADDDIMSHCRSEGPHVRGCWVVDHLTGRM